MSNTKHTQGEWTVKRDSIPVHDSGDYDPYLAVVDDKKQEIAYIPMSIFTREDEECEANARLIASAPKMLAYLEKIYKIMADENAEFDDIANLNEELESAIKSAKGE